ncbi:MAG: hypothetical protein PVF17_00080 [Ignavibacteria bacterium]|jgi:hypothetical protein
MPDMEQLTDELKFKFSKTPEEKRYLQGFIDGKNRARKEIAVISIIVFIFSLVITYYK